MSEKQSNLDIKNILGKENPSTLLKFILAAMTLLASVGTGTLYAKIDDWIKLLVAVPCFSTMLYLLIDTYKKANKDPFKYISNSNTFIQFLQGNLGDSYRKTFYDSTETNQEKSNAPIQIESDNDIKILQPTKSTKKLNSKK